MGPTGEECIRCYFFEDDISDNYIGQPVGHCMRFPPVARMPEKEPYKIIFDNQPWEHTIVQEYSWCGEFKERNQED